MKFFKKINLGLILAMIAVALVVIYCCNLENSRKSAKEDIRKACENFIDLNDKYSELPEEYQDLTAVQSNPNLDNYYTEIKNALKEQMKNDAAAEIQKTVIADNLESQLYDSSKRVIDVNREITSITAYEFDGNQVTITFNSKVTVKQKYLDIDEETFESSEKVKESSYEFQGESIALENIEGTWKVVYANLNNYTDYFTGGAY